MIRIKVEKEAAQAALESVNLTTLGRRLSAAVRQTLKSGKTEARSRIRERYTAKSPLGLGKTRSKVSGLFGQMTFSGKRNQLKKFQISPRSRPRVMPRGGVKATVVRGQGGALSRAFLISSGAVMERVGRPRLPIRNIKTIALPGMAKAVAAHVVNKMNQHLAKELAKI